jgi:hypothetical protein
LLGCKGWLLSVSRIDALASYTKGGESGQMVNPTVVTIIGQLEAHVA